MKRWLVRCLKTLPAVALFGGLLVLWIQNHETWLGILACGALGLAFGRWGLSCFLRRRSGGGAAGSEAAAIEAKRRLLRRGSLVFFAIWIALFFGTRPFSHRKIEFYDAMSQRDVSDQYRSVIPVSRALIEPLVGVCYSLAFNSDPTERLPLFITLYLCAGVLGLMAHIVSGDRPDRLLMAPSFWRRSVGFVAWTGGPILGGTVVLLLAVNRQYGYIVLANAFLRAIQAACCLGVALLAIRIVFDLIHAGRKKEGAEPDLEGSAPRDEESPPALLLWFLRDEAGRFLGTFLLAYAASVFTMSLPLPTQRIVAKLAPNEVLMDFHVHTTMSDGSLTPAERVRWYMAQGLQGAAFADHHHPRGAIMAQDYVRRKGLNFGVLMAQEYTMKGIHMNVFGIDEDITPEGYSDPPGPNPMTPEQLIPWVKDRGGYVTVNHYGPPPGSTIPHDELKRLGVDGFEIINGGKFGDRFQDTRDYCVANGLICTAGTDEHLNRELNSFVRLTVDDPKDLSLDAVFSALRRNQHQCVAISQFCYKPGPNAGEDFEEYPLLKQYFLRLNLGQSLSWFAWSAILLGIIQFRLRPRSSP